MLEDGVVTISNVRYYQQKSFQQATEFAGT